MRCWIEKVNFFSFKRAAFKFTKLLTQTVTKHNEQPDQASSACSVILYLSYPLFLAFSKQPLPCPQQKSPQSSNFINCIRSSSCISETTLPSGSRDRDVSKLFKCTAAPSIPAGCPQPGASPSQKGSLCKCNPQFASFFPQPPFCLRVLLQRLRAH